MTNKRYLRRNTLVNKGHFEMLVAALSLVKKQRHEAEPAYLLPTTEETAANMDDALVALRIVGFSIVPKGQIEFIKKELDKIR